MGVSGMRSPYFSLALESHERAWVSADCALYRISTSRQLSYVQLAAYAAYHAMAAPPVEGESGAWSLEGIHTEMSVQVPRMIVNESVVFAELDEEAVLLNVESGVYFGLDEIGTQIWNLLSKGATEEAIVASLRAEYDVAVSQLQADVAEFIELLHSNGLLRQADTDPT
jgi:hypothetical protein